MHQRIRSLARRLRDAVRRRSPQADDAGSGDAGSGLEPQYLGFDEALRDSRSSFETWWSKRRCEARLYGGQSAEAFANLRSHHAALANKTIQAAERLLDHRFALLGSEEFRPVDPDRPIDRDGYVPLDWYQDPIKQLRFPTGIHHKSWNLETMRPGLADIKIPWELSRCQHWIPLAQAFQLTRDERFATEIANQLDDFMRANPVGIGVNWTCTMDVAIRALNWALALEWVSVSDQLSDRFWLRAHSALFDHGQFIFHNLENHYEVTSNHYLSNIVGLYYVGAAFQDLPVGRDWIDYCRENIEIEMRQQVLEDGADYESSVPYHRLVTELFLGAARLARCLQQPLSQDFHCQLRKMAHFFVRLLRPDGLMPLIGDADDGRLHIFTDYADWQPQDGLHLVAAVAAYFDDASFFETVFSSGLKQSAAPFQPEPDPIARRTEFAAWEVFWWGLKLPTAYSKLHDSDKSSPSPAASAEMDESDARLSATLFPQAGLAVARWPGGYLLISNGIVGTKGFGNHKHNDLLSFELHLAGAPLIVDPGSYVYTSDPDARNLFRSTKYHNTLCIDNCEQNEFRPEWLFRMFEKAEPEHTSFAENPQGVIYEGRHGGYTRLQQPVIHARRFQLLSAESALLIVDRLIGQGTHDLRWHFHLAPGVDAFRGPVAGTVILRNDYGEFQLQTPQDMQTHIVDAWHSPSYGVRERCLAVEMAGTTSLAGESVFSFALAESSWFLENDVASRLTTAQSQAAA